jgi:hypothetical protein
MFSTDVPEMPPEGAVPPHIVYVWTSTGSLMPLEMPLDLMGGQYAQLAKPEQPAKPAQLAKPEQPAKPVEGFDNLRRTTSSVNQYIEIPRNNIVSTRSAFENIPLFRFRVEPNKKYRLNVNIRAKTDYKFAVPIMARYIIQAEAPTMIKEYSATYVSSNETVNGSEKTTSTLGTTMYMVVDSKLSVIKLTATFIGGPFPTELRVHHGLQTDDPNAILYCLEGSNAVLSEIVEVL